MSNEDRIAVVTGGSRGIGRALRLAREGFSVYFTYVGNEAAAAETLAGIEAAGGKGRAFRLDVSDLDAVAEFFKNEIKDAGALEALVNNAGITKDGLILRMKDEDWNRVLDVDLRGAFACLREAAKIMTRRRCGRIINISSVVGQMGNAGQINYVSAKAGLIGMTKAAAKELASRSVTVNAIAPGFIETEMTDALTDDLRAAYLEHIPLKRFGSAEEVASAVAFLVSEEAGYITGQVLAVNGGLYC